MPESADNSTSEDSLPFGQDLTGQTIGDYLVLQRLGRGGMADVYLTRQLSLQRPVALKVLRQDLARDSTYVDRFLREARAAAALVHANIVQIFEVGQHDKVHFIAQEYIAGRNLKTYLRRHGAVAPKLAMEILAGTANAIQKADEFHVVHRDIKPENIMLSEQGEIKVTDFGLARINNSEPSDTLTKVGVTMGTPLYMSPEQIEGGVLDARSDIYSLGVTAYHMLAGSPPFDGDSPLVIAMKQVKNDATPISTIRPDLPASIGHLIHRMIEKDPSQRPQSPAEILQTLNKINLDEAYELNVIRGPQAPSVDVNRSSASPQLRRLQQAMQGRTNSKIGRRVLLALTAAALGCGGWYGGTWIANRSTPENPLEIELEVEAEPEPPIEKLSSVDRQYESTYWHTFDMTPNKAISKQEAYWKSVIEFFPLEESGDAFNKTKLYHQRAMSRLGEIYLTQQRFDEAFEIFDELSLSGDLDRRFQVIGTVGKTIILDARSAEDFGGGREEQESAIRKLLIDVGEDRDLLNPYMLRKYDQLQIQYPTFWSSEF